MLPLKLQYNNKRNKNKNQTTTSVLLSSLSFSYLLSASSDYNTTGFSPSFLCFLNTIISIGIAERHFVKYHKKDRDVMRIILYLQISFFLASIESYFCPLCLSLPSIFTFVFRHSFQEYLCQEYPWKGTPERISHSDVLF